MFDPETDKSFEWVHSNGSNQPSSYSIPAGFAGELLEGSGFEEEVPQPGFEWREAP